MLKTARILLIVTVIQFGGFSGSLSVADPPDPERLQLTEWARNPMLADPVALSFDHQGGLYVVESARRSTVDIDIRAHKSWLLEDLASDSFDSMRSFFRRRMAPELSDENKVWLKDRNNDGVHDFRDLTTISERIRFLKDTDGDRRADVSTIFADGFQEEFTGVAAGVLPINDGVLFTVYPDLWRLRDLDGDHRADDRESLARGFGVHAAFDGHDLHGLTIGPEGKVYFSCGDNGFSIHTKEGKRLHHPNTGGVLRMNADGSELEVYAIGLRNVQEFDFDQYGNMFAVDNDGDLEDERERAVYIVEGSDSGWRLNWQFRSQGWKPFNGGMSYNPWTAEGMWKPAHPGQPAYITPPMCNYSVGPGGFKFNPGDCLNDEYRDFFFCIQFPVAKITAFRTQSVGAGFEMIDEHLFHGGLMASSVNFGPDGGLYIADWAGKWSPNEEGVIYRVDDPAVDGTGRRLEIQRLLHNGLAENSIKELSTLLGHADRRIRQLAQFELVRRDQAEVLLSIAENGDRPQLSRIHAMWGLVQMGEKAGDIDQIATRLPWSDPDPQIRQQCARVAGDKKLKSAAASLFKLIDDSAPLVQSHAAIAAGKLGVADAMPCLIQLLESNNNEDPFIRHAAVMGLSGCAAAEELAKLSTHASSAVRLGAVLALRRQKSFQIKSFLRDKDTVVLREAIRAVHDDGSIREVLPAVAGLLTRPNLPLDEPIVRRILSANFRIGTREAGERLVQFIVRPSSFAAHPLAETLQIEALTSLVVWQQSPFVDRVEGRIRARETFDSNVGRELLEKHLGEILAIAGPELKIEATRFARELRLRVEPEVLREWVMSTQQPIGTRVESLLTLHQQDAAGLERLARKMLRASEKELRHTAFKVLVERNRPLAWKAIQDSWADDSTMEDQQLFISLLPQIDTESSHAKLLSLLDDLLNGVLIESITLDVVESARRQPTRYRKQIAAIEAMAEDHAHGKFQWSLSGGDAVRGEQVYRSHVGAQCVRCHDAGGKGKQAGPVLDGIASRVERRYLLESIIRPNLAIADGFKSVTIALDDGRILNGTVIRENESEVVLADSQPNVFTIDNDEVTDRRENDVSAMPDMTQILNPREVRDLVAYLSTLRTPQE